MAFHESSSGLTAADESACNWFVHVALTFKFAKQAEETTRTTVSTVFRKPVVARLNEIMNVTYAFPFS